jgi:DHA1 family tetracycline resistance protein-like MFS transporter
VMLGLSKTGLLLWLGIPMLNLMSLVWPSAQSLMSREVGVQEQGQLQGAVNSLRGMAGLMGPGLFTYIFSRSIATGSRWPHAPGMAFFVAAGILLVSLIVAESVRPARVAAS